MAIRYEETQFGFDYGAAKITRMMSDKSGWIVLGLETPRTKGVMQIYVTKTGKVRVYSPDGTEWEPNDK